MTFWISAKATDDGKPNWLADFVPARDFEHATEIAHERARRLFDERAYKLTSVTEQPVYHDGPVAYVLELTAARRVG